MKIKYLIIFNVLAICTSCKYESLMFLHGSERKNAKISRNPEKGNYVMLKDSTIKPIKRILFEEDRIGGRGKIIYKGGGHKKFYNNEILECQTKHSFYKSINGSLARRIIKGKINVYTAKDLTVNEYINYGLAREFGRTTTIYSTGKSNFLEQNNDGNLMEYDYSSIFLLNFKYMLRDNEDALKLVSKYEKQKNDLTLIKKKNLFKIISFYNSSK